MQTHFVVHKESCKSVDRCFRVQKCGCDSLFNDLNFFGCCYQRIELISLHLFHGDFDWWHICRKPGPWSETNKKWHETSFHHHLIFSIFGHTKNPFVLQSSSLCVFFPFGYSCRWQFWYGYNKRNACKSYSSSKERRKTQWLLRYIVLWLIVYVLHQI